VTGVPVFSSKYQGPGLELKSWTVHCIAGGWPQAAT